MLGGAVGRRPVVRYRPVDASVSRAGAAGPERSPLAAVGSAADGVVAARSVDAHAAPGQRRQDGGRHGDDHEAAPLSGTAR